MITERTLKLGVKEDSLEKKGKFQLGDWWAAVPPTARKSTRQRVILVTCEKTHYLSIL